ncbi:hypothetical protein DL95DRAFT_472697 [Leptodontidium sp. 2 PMI_412]|nr:hypothetical protein DL95DRAFT_472697 [Leptodontidium sp. 2 PMI_412]
MNWDLRESRDMVNNDPKFIKSVKMLQTHVSTLARAGKIGQKACDVYQDGNPKSVDFTLSSLLFASMTEGCEVKGLY